MSLAAGCLARVFPLALCVMLFHGCTSDRPGPAKTIEPKRMIHDILTIRTPDSLTVVVQGDRPLVYTVSREEAPPALVIAFADTGLDRLGPEYFPPENFAVHSIRNELSENGTDARMVLGLKGGAPYRLVAEDNRLKIIFTPPAAPAPGAPPPRGS